MIEINKEKVIIDGSGSQIANDIASLCYSLICHGYSESAIIKACALGIGRAKLQRTGKVNLQSRDDSSDDGKTGKTDTVTMSKFDDIFGQLFRDDERG